MIKNKKTELNQKIFQKDYDKQLIIKNLEKQSTYHVMIIKKTKQISQQKQHHLLCILPNVKTVIMKHLYIFKIFSNIFKYKTFSNIQI